MKIFHKNLVLFLFVTIFLVLPFSFPQTTFANNDAKINVVTAPDQPLRYNFLRLTEKVKMTWLQMFNTKEVGNYTAELVSRRAKELSYIVTVKKQPYLETVTSRYITYVGLLTEQLDTKNIEKEKVREVLNNQQKEFEELRDNYPAQTAEWLLLQQAADTANVLYSQAQD